MNSKHHYTKFMNVSQLQGAQCFHLDGLTLPVETFLGLNRPSRRRQHPQKHQ